MLVLSNVDFSMSPILWLDCAVSTLPNLSSTKDVFEEIKEAKKCSYALGFKLNLSIDILKAVRLKNLRAEDRVLEVIDEYKLSEPKPSWKDIADALKSDLVNLPKPAQEIESKLAKGICIPHCCV